jgi:predicted ABC-type ATPase
MKALALTVALALCAGRDGFADERAAAGPKTAQSGHAEAAIGPKASRTIVVHGKEVDLDAPLPMAPRTLPDGHPLLRETALADDGQEFGGRLAPGFDTPERRAIHEAIVADAVAGVTPQASPVLFVMAGGTGSGKGFVRTRLEATGEIPTRNRVLIDPDEFLEQLPEWQAFEDAGDGRAAEVLHEESSMLAKRIRALAVKRRLDVVLDITLSDADSAQRLFDQFRAGGYEIRLFAVAADARVAAVQAADRARLSNRWVPWSVLLGAHRGLAAAFEGYARLVDRASLFGNDVEEPRLVAESVARGDLRLFDGPSYRLWLESSRRINPAATTLGEVYGRTPQ